jgi:hypothetical protein
MSKMTLPKEACLLIHGDRHGLPSWNETDVQRHLREEASQEIALDGFGIVHTRLSTTTRMYVE